MGRFLTENWQVIIGMVGAAIAWFGGRELKKTEYKTKEAGALSELQRVYDKYIEHDRERMDDALKRIKTLETEIASLKTENIMQRKENLAQRKENGELMEVIRNWEKRYNALEKKYNDLQDAHERLKKSFENYKKKSK